MMLVVVEKVFYSAADVVLKYFCSS